MTTEQMIDVLRQKEQEAEARMQAISRSIKEAKDELSLARIAWTKASQARIEAEVRASVRKTDKE